MAYEAEVALAHRLADAARAAILPLFRTGLGSERKADRTPVTEADRAETRAATEAAKASATELAQPEAASNASAAAAMRRAKC